MHKFCLSLCNTLSAHDFLQRHPARYFRSGYVLLLILSVFELQLSFLFSPRLRCRLFPDTEKIRNIRFQFIRYPSPPPALSLHVFSLRVVGRHMKLAGIVQADREPSHCRRCSNRRSHLDTKRIFVITGLPTAFIARSTVPYRLVPPMGASTAEPRLQAA